MTRNAQYRHHHQQDLSRAHDGGVTGFHLSPEAITSAATSQGADKIEPELVDIPEPLVLLWRFRPEDPHREQSVKEAGRSTNPDFHRKSRVTDRLVDLTTSAPNWTCCDRLTRRVAQGS